MKIINRLKGQHRTFATMNRNILDHLQMAGQQQLEAKFASTRSGSYSQRVVDHDKATSNVLANQHMRYVPRKRLLFDY